jgi:hypothetical protein
VTACAHTLWGLPDGLVCNLGDDCDGTHRYAASAGADLETVTHVEMGDQ